MSEAVNPYQSPETTAVPEKPLLAQGLLTEPMLIYLRGASPWLRFIGILGFVFAGLTVLWGILSSAFIPRMTRAWGGLPEFETFSGFFAAAIGGTTVVFTVGLGALMFFPSLFIYRFGERIRSYLRTGTEQELEQAFKNNKSFWKFSGILCIIYLAFIPLAIVAAIIVALVSAFS